MIGNVCETDVLTLDGLFGDLTYTLGSPGQPLTESFVIVQDHTECPAQCLLSMPDGGDIPMNYGIPMQTKPVIDIFSEDKSLNGMFIDLMFSCRSTLSQLGPDGKAPVAVHEFRVDYIDECELSEIYPALTQDAIVFVFSLSELPFVPPYSQHACNSFENHILYPDDHPDNAPVFRLSENDPGKIQVIAGHSSNEGVYLLELESCITIFSSKEQRCVISAQFQVNVVDPCPTTEILSTGFNRIMQAPQM